MTRTTLPRPRAAQRDYVLGAPISLQDFLALPPDGTSYGRDEQGRLVLMTPDDSLFHRLPLDAGLTRLKLWAERQRRHRFSVIPEPGIGFERILDTKGRVLPESFLGPKALEPDLACFAGTLRFVPAGRGLTHFSPRGLRLVVEVLSPSTWRSDLGEGADDDVDRLRTYAANGVPEYFVLNAGLEGLPLPPRSGLFLALDRRSGEYRPLPTEHARVAGHVRGHPALATGRVCSRALRGFVLDLASFWRSLPRGA